jgi:hypothetical protein
MCPVLDRPPPHDLVGSMDTLVDNPQRELHFE